MANENTFLYEDLLARIREKTCRFLHIALAAANHYHVYYSKGGAVHPIVNSLRAKDV